MRIISGRLKGRPLSAPKGRSLRPTADQVKETLFNMIGSHVQQATVLDLFAGTGNVGIEALSRGAALAVFVEKNSRHAQILSRNIAACDIEAESTVYRGDANKILTTLHKKQMRFDLVFLDPPYDRNLVKPALDHLHMTNAVQSGAHIVVEHSLDEPLPDDLDCFRMEDQRKYGKSLVSFFEYVV
jgi:16S rRNA (guanine966-N2)-methyltransferase